MPGVGKNLQDHIYPLGLNFIADVSLKAKGETWTYIQTDVHTMPNILKYLTVADGPIASIGGLEGFGFIRTRFANYTHLDWPDFQIHFLSGCISSGTFFCIWGSSIDSLFLAHFTDDGHTFKNRIGINDQQWNEVFFPFVRKECFTLLPVMLKPQSRGWIKLRSKNPYDKPLIDPRYYSHPEDLEKTADAMEISYQLGTSAAFKKKFNSKPSGRIVPGNLTVCTIR